MQIDPEGRSAALRFFFSCEFGCDAIGLHRPMRAEYAAVECQHRNHRGCKRKVRGVRGNVRMAQAAKNLCVWSLTLWNAPKCAGDRKRPCPQSPAGGFRDSSSRSIEL